MLITEVILRSNTYNKCITIYIYQVHLGQKIDAQVFQAWEICSISKQKKNIIPRFHIFRYIKTVNDRKFKWPYSS